MTDEPLSPAQETSVSRHATMRAALDLAVLTGLEIGPLADPIVGKSEGRVRYVDHTDTETLRRAYAENPEIDAAAIVEVDAVWGARSLTECIGGEVVDYVMASHVAEHVPDLVTWLGEVRSVLRAGGELRLALPDARFSHDVLRGETRLVDMLAAWVLRARRPQVRDVLDFRLHVAPSADARTLYAGTADLSRLRPLHSFAEAVQAAGWARDIPEHYFDVHCWVVSPRGFAGLMHELAQLGLLRLACVQMVDTAPPIWEFYAFMTPCDDPAEAARSWREAQDGLRHPLPGSGTARALAAAAQQAGEDAAERASLQAAHREALAANAELLARLRDCQSRLEAVQRSRSWRLTAPFRRALARIG